ARVLFEGFEEDAVEIAGEAAAQVGGRRLAKAADLNGGRGGEVGGGLGHGGARPDGWLLGDYTDHFVKQAAAKAVRHAAGEQLIEYHSESVDICGGAGAFATHLFGAGVFGRHEHQTRARGECGSFACAIRHQLGDAEVEQFYDTVGSHQDIAGL